MLLTFKTMQARLLACGRGDVSTPSFGSPLTPISTMGGGGGDYAYPILMSPPSFESHRRACSMEMQMMPFILTYIHNNTYIDEK